MAVDGKHLLPVELWVKAFDSPSLHDLVRASLVSVHWRGIAIAHPRYWSHIAVNEGVDAPLSSFALSLATARLTRSSQAPIEVSIALHRRFAFADSDSTVAQARLHLLQAVRANVHRCRRLRLHIPAADIVNECPSLDEGCAPLLESLDLSTSINPSRPFTPYSPALSTQLRIIRLDGLTPPALSADLVFPNLEELALINNPSADTRIAPGVLFDLCPKLRCLTCDRSTLALDLNHPSGAMPSIRAGLSRLEGLTLSGAPIIMLLSELHEQFAAISDILVHEPVGAIFQTILSHMTSAESVELRLSGSDDERRRVLSIVASPSGSTRRMTFIPRFWPSAFGRMDSNVGEILPLVTKLVLPLSDWVVLFARPRALPA